MSKEDTRVHRANQAKVVLRQTLHLQLSREETCYETLTQIQAMPYVRTPAIFDQGVRNLLQSGPFQCFRKCVYSGTSASLGR